MDYGQYYNPYMNNFNPYLNRQPQQPNQFQNQFNTMAMPHSDIVKVNGRGGAEVYQMGINSKALLLDENEAMVWLVITDGAGYKTITPYDVTPHTDEPVKSPENEILANLESRIQNLERIVNEYGKSDYRNDEQEKQSGYRNTKK